MTAHPNVCIAAVTSLLESYATRGVFRGFAVSAASAKRATYRLTWHRERVFELTVDVARGTLRLPSMLPAVSPEMFRELKAWVAGRMSEDVPEHRRMDPGRVSVRVSLRNGEPALTVRSLDCDLDYAVRKVVALVHEIYLEFLHDGRYYEWLVETFDLDPDYVQFT
jgi:hypothetical protein